jgi:predicted transcriptional regulator
VKEADYKKQFVTSIVQNHFSNSYKELVSFFAEEKKISAAELKEIIHMIENKK